MSLPEPNIAGAAKTEDEGVEYHFGARVYREPKLIWDPKAGETLEDASEYFGLYSRVRDVERSLQDVRKRRKSRDEHESYLKLLDEEILQLRYKYHPDRARISHEKDIEDAQNRLAALNAIRTVLDILNKTFLDSSDVEHLYGFHANLSEDDVREHIYQNFYKISFLWERKQERLVWEIRQFLKASKKCLKSFLGKKWFDFLDNRNRAVSHLDICNNVYEKLAAEFEAADEEFKTKSLDSAHKLIWKMSSDCFRDLLILRELKRVAKEHIAKSTIVINILESMDMIDGYFVWPFVHYMNVIIMCNAMMPPNSNIYDEHREKEVPSCDREQSAYLLPYYLALYLCGSEGFEEEIKEKLGKEDLDKEELRNEFLEQMKQIGKTLEEKFSAENYIERGSTNQLVDDCMECLRKLDAFEEEKDKVMSDIERLEVIDVDNSKIDTPKSDLGSN